VSLLARDIDLAALATAIASQSAPDPNDPWSREAPVADVPPVRRVGVPMPHQLDFDGDADSSTRFASAVDELAAVGIEVCPFDIAPMLEVTRLLYGGAFVAERYEAVGAFVSAHRDDVDPVVGKIISDAAQIPAWQVFRDRTELERLRRIVDIALRDVDAVIVPSVPRVPRVAEVADGPFAVNEKLGTYTNFVNLLDLCALTVPTEIATPDRPPFSVTFVAPAWHDSALVSLGQSLHLDRRATHRSA
jgi:allophanate hydrolase